MNIPVFYSEHVGFWYSQAIRELSHRMTYEHIADELGYKSKTSIFKILRGATPRHISGEALWALYVDTFHRKPPLKEHQSKPLLTA